MTNKEVERMMELEEKNSLGPEPRLTDRELNELQVLLDKNYDFVGV